MSAPPVPPMLSHSQARDSHAMRPNAPAMSQATRSMHEAAPSQRSSGQARSLPASQESVVSTNSSSTGPRLHSSSSNLSQYTDLTSPSSQEGKVTSLRASGADAAKGVACSPGAQEESESVNQQVLDRLAGGWQPRNGMRAQLVDDRPRTPDTGSAQPEYSLASQMSLASPMNGSKRTASGAIKSIGSVPTTPLTATWTGRSRADSTSSTGSRAGELAATLKTRLGYAMAKVQHGWEHRSIDEVQQLAAHKLSPAVASPSRHSMSHLDRRPISSGLSNGTSRLSMHDSYGRFGGLERPGYAYATTQDYSTSPPSKRHSGTYSTFFAQSAQQHPHLGTAPLLQPAADIQSASSRNGFSNQRAPLHVRSGSHGTDMSPPQTPRSGNTRRPPTLRTQTQTQQDEQDAVAALIGLQSPHSSGHLANRGHSQASSTQHSPLRSEFALPATPRKAVTFARSESSSDSSSGRPSSSGSSVRNGIDRAMDDIEDR